MSFCNTWAGRSQHLPLGPLWVTDEVKKSVVNVVLQANSLSMFCFLWHWGLWYIWFLVWSWLFFKSLLICDLNLNLLVAFSISLNTFHSLEIRLIITSLIPLTLPACTFRCSGTYNCTIKQMFPDNELLSLTYIAFVEFKSWFKSFWPTGL